MTGQITNIPNPGKKKRIVIVGGGFGGLKIARKLKGQPFQVVLLDKNNYHLFQPLLYQVATAGIEPSAISFPFRKIFKGYPDFHIRICEVQQVVPAEKRIETSIGSLDYDYLVIATGCYTNYFGNNKMALRTMSLKTTAEALHNRNQVLESFEKALNTPDAGKRKQLMTFAIVGGGATGIELAGALAEMRKFILPHDYPDLDLSLMRIILIDGASRLLSAFSAQSSEEVKKYLTNLGVELLLDEQVKSYENGILGLSSGSTLATENVYWVAGVKANSLAGFPTESYGPGNRLKVNAYNQVEGFTNIFAIGDTALMLSEQYPKGHPQVVQPAIQQAMNVVKNLKHLEHGQPLIPFKYNNKGSMATIGRNKAVVELPKIRFGGFPAWAVWLFIHLMSIVGVKNRLFIFVDWMWSYFTYDPSLRLIIKPQPSADEEEKKEN
ncbi:NAD(P)/FAD-dependent oxidoreductase [Phocaeicola sp.]